MGVVGHDQATDATAEQGVTVSETCVPGGRIVSEFNYCDVHRLWVNTSRRMMPPKEVEVQLEEEEAAALQVWLMVRR